jgi:Leucine-rich repeat (LRR) protein
MENLAGPRLLQAFFDHATDEVFGNMDNLSKSAIRLSCKNAKSFVDGTVTTAAGGAGTLDAILRCDWQLSELCIKKDDKRDPVSPNDFNSLLRALFSKFPTLQVLEINSPTAYDLPANIGQLSKLKNLKITRANFIAFPASFGQLSSLERLEFYELYRPKISSTQLTIEGLAPLKQLTRLKYLKINGGIVSKPFFPDWLDSCRFPVLEDIILAGGLLQSFPSSISNFSNLTALTIERNLIQQIPDSIGSLKLLKKFSLLYTKEPLSLPTSFSQLTALEELIVTTDMQSFGRIEHFHKLTELTFCQQMQEGVIMPYPEFLWTFTSLQNLYLSRSAVSSLPDALGALNKLELLRLWSHQNLEELPESLGNLTCLTQLKITNCPMLIKLPESIGSLKVLRKLEIYSCPKVTTVPESIGHLESLEKLNLTHIKRLPSSIGNLHALKVLMVDSAVEVFLPESFADLILDKPIEECSLELVFFARGADLVLDSPRVDLALGVLRKRRVLLYVP